MPSKYGVSLGGNNIGIFAFIVYKTGIFKNITNYFANLFVSSLNNVNLCIIIINVNAKRSRSTFS
ncbi:hypothetical protein LY11_02369 [Pedobacter cryoconitis]|uniref:Uncharacterized protein n=1 Tax=Pedobacter cryoconitis TaxID=188932 RepID=A0A327SQH3_9SPHI|nr:hypothetical protein LY11_02369 [Pedobacter cryoconitis]